MNITSTLSIENFQKFLFLFTNIKINNLSTINLLPIDQKFYKYKESNLIFYYFLYTYI